MANATGQLDAGDKGEADAGAGSLGAVYGKAFLGAAQSAGTTVDAIAEFDSFIDDVLAKLPRFESVLASGVVSPEDKIALLTKALAKQASPLFMSFLKVVAKNGRLDALRAIHRAVHTQYDISLKRIPVRMTTASPVDDALAARVAQAIEKLVGGEPVLSRFVNPDLIGGMILRVGDTIYDASVATQLKQVRGQMINRSVHEIQSRRDRFRNPEGS